ncbi:MAG TPA: prolyl oligopeptidase family serine peptidase [Vicinamibacterales bacterium]
MMRRCLAGTLLGFVAILASSLAIRAQGGAPRPGHRVAAPARLTIEALLDIRHPSNPIWSRDSRWIAFMWERAGVSNLYVVAADGSAKPVALTTDGGPVVGPFWTADSKAIGFMRGGSLMRVSTDGRQPPTPFWAEAPGRGLAVSRDATQVAYLVDWSGGGAGRGGRASGGQGVPGAGGPTVIHIRSLVDGSDRVVASVEGTVGGVTWTGDGEHLTFTVGGGGQTIRHEQTPAYSGSKIIYSATENAPGPPGRTFIVSASGGEPLAYSAGVGGPGGRGGANRWIDATHFVIDRTVEFKRREISIGDTAGGEPRLVHQQVKETFWSMTGGAQGGAQASPDGRWLSFLSDRDGWDHLFVMPATGGEAVQVTKGRYEAWRPSWSPDGTRIAFDSNEGANPGSRHLSVAAIGGDPARFKVTVVTSGRGTDTAAQWSPNGRMLVYQHTDPQNSADLWVVDVATPGSRPRRLTDSMPPAIDRAALVEPQLVHYTGADGQSVPAYLFVPRGLDRSRKHPAIVWLHGDGVNQNYDGWHIERNYAVYYSFHQFLLQRGFVVLAPDYRGSIGYGSAWREGVYMDVGGKDFRDAAMSADFLKTLPYVDTSRVGVWGLSYGGFFTLLAVTERPTTFRAAVDVAGVADYAMYYEDPYHGGWTVSRIGTPEQNPRVYAQASPVSHVDRLVTPLLVLHGTADVNVPYLHSVRLLDELLKNGKGHLVQFMTYPGEFHYFTREHVLRDAWTRVSAFFDANLRR